MTQYIDPVCGMTVKPDSPHEFAHAGQTFHFCSAGCLKKFQADPQSFLKPAAEPKPSSCCHGGSKPATVRSTPPQPGRYGCPMCPGQEQDGPGVCKECGMALEPIGPPITNTRTVYICPMHLNIQQDEPGLCPICGMALEPKTLDIEESNPELQQMSRRFWVALVFSIPVFLLAMLSHVLSEWVPDFHVQTRQFVEGILATPVVWWCGWPFMQRAWQSLRTRHLNMFTLIGMGVSVAWGYSVVALLWPGLFPPVMRMEDGAVSVYFEAAAIITTLVLLGQVLELKARSQTSSAIKALLSLAPKTARKIDAHGQEVDVPTESLMPGDRVRIRPGEKIPTDGVVEEGSSHVDESMITGESVPVSKQTGDALIGGTLNGSGALVLKVGAMAQDTLLSRIVHLVSEAQRSRAPVQRLVDTVSGYFVPAVIVAALLTFVAWFGFGPEPVLAHAVVNAIAVLIIACPCALGLATPMSIMVGTGKGAQHGVLIKNAEALEAMQKVDTLVVDKTGTLTEGKPAVQTIQAIESSGLDDAAVLQLAASLEASSEHPLGQAILEAAKVRNLAIQPATDFESMTGKGVHAKVKDQTVALGNRALLDAYDLNLPNEIESDANRLRELGQTVVFLVVEGGLAGYLGISDPVKANAAETLKSLREEGITVIMLTGDHRATAHAIASQLGITEVHAEVLPQDKAAVVKRLQDQGKTVAMAGDGINDAPALAQASVGIAMGSGTDIAMESASVTLVKGDLSGILRAHRLSIATMKNIRQNLLFAFLYNALGIPVAAGLLYPWFGLLLSPMIAAAAMSLSSVSVISNALRLRRVTI